MSAATKTIHEPTRKIRTKHYYPPHTLNPEPQISSLLNERIVAGDFPSAVYLVAERGQEVFSDALGHSVVEPYRIAANRNTIYDLASLTKPLVTGLLCARRLQSGALKLDLPISTYLSEFERDDKRTITVRHLLTHTSGLPAWRPLYILADNDKDQILNAIASQQLEFAPGTHVTYSDLGFITVGLLLQRLEGRPLVQLARDEIFSPLKLEHTFFNPDVALQTGIAACETGNAYEAETCRETGAGEYAALRRNLIWGEVHDGNAHFLGGAAGHAGLFSTASETFILAEQFLPETSRLLKPEYCELMKVNMTEGLNEARSLAWQLAMTPESTAGPDLPPNSFGHNGFTGTSCWMNPDHGDVFILLTNRTHSRPAPFVNINKVRRQFHTLAMNALGQR